MDEEVVDVLIIGAGPSGAVAASYLDHQGFKVKVVEKCTFPRFVIGESLLPRCMDHFEEVGLLEGLMSYGFEVKRGARFMKNGKVCNFDFSKKHTKGWDWTWQVPRADFDKVLTDSLLSRGVDITFEREVIAVDFMDDIVITSIKDLSGNDCRITSKCLIDSSGYGRVLPKLLGLEKPSTIPRHSSVFTHVEDINRPDGAEGTLITFDIVSTETWLWVIPFSNGTTSIGFVGPTETLEALEGDGAQKLRKLLKSSDYYYDRFKDVDFSFDPIEIKNFSKSVTRLHGKGYALTGNSAEFLDPVFSSGVTFATESALLAAKLFARELRNEKVDWDLEYTKYIMEGVDVFATYVKEWYTGDLQKIFFHEPENPVIKAQICAVLAGYVWDKSNPFVKNHHRLVKTVARIADMEDAKDSKVLPTDINPS